jgi:uncharacterized protein (TIGR02145 family)
MIKQLSNQLKLIIIGAVVGGVMLLGWATAGVLMALSIITPLAVDYNLTEPTHTTMQSFTGSDCANLQTYTTIELTDQRGDDQRYRVRKMPDGRCWMIDNLKLGGTGAPIILTSADSNVANDFTIPANAVYSAGTRATNGVCASTKVSGASGVGGFLTCDGTDAVIGTDDNENYNFIAYVDPANASNTFMSENCAHGASGLDAGSLTDCGYLYNWYTATAGNGVYDTMTSDSQNVNTVTSDICPAGWRLPKGGNGWAAGNDFSTLNAAMYNGANTASVVVNSAAYVANWNASGPFAGSYSGYWAAMFNGQGSEGVYLSSSAFSATKVRAFSLSYNKVSFGGEGSDKYSGYAVRCMR